MSCSTSDQCCSLCGADSYRCARGPCSTSFVMKSIFSISMPTTHVGFWDVVLAIYGILPYLVPVVLALELLLHRRSWTRVFAFLFIPIGGIINVILVKSIGSCTECARPCGSCVTSQGMPSGHAANAIGLCLWTILETLGGVGRHWSLRTKVLVITAAMLLFVPVPYGRMYLGDHTDLQVVVGSANGIVLSLLYFALLRFVVAKRLDRASQWLAHGRCGVTVHNDFSSPKQASSPSLESPLLTVERSREIPESASPQESARVQAPATPV